MGGVLKYLTFLNMLLQVDASLNYIPCFLNLIFFLFLVTKYSKYISTVLILLPNIIDQINVRSQAQAEDFSCSNFSFQCGFFLIAFIANFTGKKSGFAKARDVIFASAAFPIGMFVGIVFWTLWAINRWSQHHKPYKKRF